MGIEGMDDKLPRDFADLGIPQESSTESMPKEEEKKKFIYERHFCGIVQPEQFL